MSSEPLAFIRQGDGAVVLNLKMWTDVKDRLCGLVVRVPGYWTEMYCDSCEVRTEFIYVM
jgi:hypothetical protein